MPTPLLDPAKVRRTAAKWNEGLYKETITKAAKACGVSNRTLLRHLELAELQGIPVARAENKYTLVGRRLMGVPGEVEIAEIEDDDLPIEQIIAQRKAEFAQKKKHHDSTRLIPIRFKLRGPIGLLKFGDPHLDDDGTDIVTLEAHSDLTHQEGIYGCNLGDTTNNWVGRYARLYSQQNCGRTRAIKIGEWFIKRTRWAYLLGGNHDAWSGDDDPMIWITKQAGALYQSSEVRLELQFPEGAPFVINARHDFSGSSQWNPTHGVMKAVQMGSRDDLSICGHKHISGYGILKDPQSGKACHALQVGSYKVIDRYAKEKGFRDQSLGPAAMAVINPLLPANHPDRCKIFWDPFEGAKYVRMLRADK